MADSVYKGVSGLSFVVLLRCLYTELQLHTLTFLNLFPFSSTDGLQDLWAVTSVTWVSRVTLDPLLLLDIGGSYTEYLKCY